MNVRKREKEREEKRKGKNGDQNRLFFLFFYKSVRMFFLYAQWSFFKYIRKSVSKLRRSCPLFFAIKIIIIIIIINSLFLEDDILSKYNYLSNIWSSANKKNII